MQTDETYELTIDMILEQLKDRDISNTEKKRMRGLFKVLSFTERILQFIKMA